MPQWQCDADYDFTKKLDRAGWAWEFMRRNEKYCDDFAKSADAWKAVQRKGFICYGDGPYEAARISQDLGADWEQLGAIADPNCDSVPKFIMSGPVQPDGEQVDRFYYQPDETDLLLQKPEFATLTFDLRRPLFPQLKRARLLLLARKKHVKSIKPARSSEDEWPLYLRVLDAKAAGAKTSEIVDTISEYKKLGKTVETNYQASDRVADHHKRALQLRNNPKSLIL